MSKNKVLCSFPAVIHSGVVEEVRISDLHTFKEHPFKMEQDVELFKLMQSIEKEGVLVPLLARPNPFGDGYEIIAGHRRKAACEWAGVQNVPVVIKEMDDNQAIIAMVDSNLQREYIKPSEKAFAYKMKLEAMKKQRRRTDLDEIEDLTSSPLGTKLEDGANVSKNIRADEELAKQVGESRNQIARYIRLTNLIPKILDMVDSGQIAFRTAVEISFLKEEEQYDLHAVMDIEQCTPSLSQAQRMKRLSQQGTLDIDMLYQILEEEKPNQREMIKIRADVLDDYFPKSYTPNQKIQLIEKLVKEWNQKNRNFSKGKAI